MHTSACSSPTSRVQMGFGSEVGSEEEASCTVLFGVQIIGYKAEALEVKKKREMRKIRTYDIYTGKFCLESKKIS